MSRQTADVDRLETSSDLEAVRRIFRERDDHAAPLGASEVAELLNCTHRTAFTKLEELTRWGELASKKPSANLRVWWVPIEGERPQAITDRIGDRPEVGPATIEEVIAEVGNLIPGRTEEARRERAKDILAGYRFLKENAPTTVEEIQKHAYEDADEPGVELGNAERRWVNYMREPLAALPGVIWGGSRSRRWEFVHPSGNLALQLRVDVDPQVRDLNVCHEEGRPRQAQHNRALVQLALTHLAEVGEARKADFQRALPDYYINYTDFDGLWVYLIRPALEELDTVDSSRRRFRYIGDSNE